MSKNNKLKKACEVWIQGALRLLATKQVPYIEDLEVTFTENGYQTRGGIYTVDFGRLYAIYRDELLSLPEYSSVENIVLNTESLASILSLDAAGVMPSEVSSQKYFIERHVIGLLLEYLTTALDFTFKPAAFEAIYEKLEQYIYLESFEGVWLVHIRNLSFDDNTIRLDRGVTLRQATYEEKTRAVKEVYRFPFFGRHVDIPKIFLEIRHSVGRIEPPDNQEATIIAQAVILALRLIKDNPVGIVSSYWDVPGQPFRPNQGSTYSPLLLPGAFSGEPFILTQEDIAILPKLYKKAKKAIKNSKLSIVITRLEDAYTRTKNEDKLIDYWTALEALFLSDESSYQMSKTLALAIAYYISSNELERQAIKQDISRSHDLRSDVVHGKKINQNINLLEILTKTGTHLRKALRKRIEEV